MLEAQATIPAGAAAPAAEALVTFDTHPDRYVHWKLAVDGPIATLLLDVDEARGIRPGYRLKLNSYDLGVDIELHDALQRIRFEHPEVKCVVVTSSTTPPARTSSATSAPIRVSIRYELTELER